MASRSRKLPIDRFESKYSIDSNGCWIWSAAIDKDGYGCFRFSHEGGSKSWGHAYRFAYEHYVGKIPSDKQLDHTCRVRSCVNPFHLEIVDLVENVMRGQSFSAQNARKTHCVHNHPLSGSNLYVQPSTGYRYCRQCKRNSEKRRMSAKGM